ncbi:hypothetical protein LTR15_002181 [Elasticomyces elasticus]|nr:hypothetical protein LTR15_002181 [Elasticomyces elasticus]
MAGKKRTGEKTSSRESSTGGVKRPSRPTAEKTPAKAAKTNTKKASKTTTTSKTRPSDAQFAEEVIKRVTGCFKDVIHKHAITDFVSFVVCCLRETHRDLFEQQDMESILEQAHKFHGPTGDPDAEVAFILHWAPDHDSDSDSDEQEEEESGSEADSDDGEVSESSDDESEEEVGDVIVLDDEEDEIVIGGVVEEVVAAGGVVDGTAKRPWVLSDDEEEDAFVPGTRKRKATTPPAPKPAKKMSQPAKKRSPARMIGGRRYWRTVYPVKRYSDTFDLGYETMRTLQKLFPKVASQAYLFDLYKRKQKFLGADGERLNGTRPYEALRKCGSSAVVLFGGVVKEAFIAEFGNFKNGQEMEIGGRMRTVFHLEHPEWIHRYSTAARLRPLKTRLEELREVTDGKLDVSVRAVEAMIEERSNSAAAVARAQKRADRAPKQGPITLPSAASIAAAVEYLDAVTAMAEIIKAKIRGTDLTGPAMLRARSRIVEAAEAAGLRGALKEADASKTTAAPSAPSGEPGPKKRKPRTPAPVRTSMKMSLEARDKCSKAQIARVERRWDEKRAAAQGDPVALAEVEAGYVEALVQREKSRKGRKELLLPSTPRSAADIQKVGENCRKGQLAAADRKWADKRAAAQGDPFAMAEFEIGFAKHLKQRETNRQQKLKKAALKGTSTDETVAKREPTPAPKSPPKKQTGPEKWWAGVREKGNSAESNAKKSRTWAKKAERKWEERIEACNGDPVKLAAVALLKATNEKQRVNGAKRREKKKAKHGLLGHRYVKKAVAGYEAASVEESKD